MYFKIECLGGHSAATNDGPHGFSFDDTSQYILTFVRGEAITERKSITEGLMKHFPGKFRVESMRNKPDVPDFVPAVQAPPPARKPRKAATAPRVKKEKAAKTTAKKRKASSKKSPSG